MRALHTGVPHHTEERQHHARVASRSLSGPAAIATSGPGAGPAHLPREAGGHALLHRPAVRHHGRGAEGPEPADEQPDSCGRAADGQGRLTGEESELLVPFPVRADCAPAMPTSSKPL